MAGSLEVKRRRARARALPEVAVVWTPLQMVWEKLPMNKGFMGRELFLPFSGKNPLNF